MMNDKKINILLVDDHSMVIEGMKAILSNMPFIQIAATASNAFEALTALKAHSIQLAFLDVNLPDINGIELCARIKKEFPLTAIIGLSTFKQRSYVSQMINNGASGYLVKSAGREEIEEAINTVLAGRMYFGADINSNKPETISEEDAPMLTRREKEILVLIAEGMNSNQIAEKLFLSPYTVDTHRKNLLTKFNVGNTIILIKKASGFGFL